MKEKTQVRLVCHQWKDLAEELLKQHKTLGITSRRHFIMEDVDMGLPMQEMCKRHPISSDDVISIPVYMPSNSQMILLKSALKMLPGIQVVYFNYKPMTTTSYSNMVTNNLVNQLLEEILLKYSAGLTCLCIPFMFSIDIDHPLSKGLQLPNLQDFKMKVPNYTSSPGGQDMMRKLLISAENLKHLSGYQDFNAWNLLPKGFRTLDMTVDVTPSVSNEDLGSIFSSPAVDTIQEITTVRFRTSFNQSQQPLEIKSYFNSLHTLGVLLDLIQPTRTQTLCFDKLARFLSFCPVLTTLDIVLDSFEYFVLETEPFTRVLSKCLNLVDLSLRTVCAIDFDDESLTTAFVNMKNLRRLRLRKIPMKAIGLTVLSTHESLEEFVYRPGKQDTLESDALTCFIETKFSRNLTKLIFKTKSKLSQGFTGTQGFFERVRKICLDLDLDLKEEIHFKCNIRPTEKNMPCHLKHDHPVWSFNLEMKKITLQ